MHRKNDGQVKKRNVAGPLPQGILMEMKQGENNFLVLYIINLVEMHEQMVLCLKALYKFIDTRKFLINNWTFVEN